MAREVTLQLLPHLTSRAVIVFEGPTDWAALSTLALKLQDEQGVALPSLYGIGLVEAGGISEVPKLCSEAKKLGLRAVAVVDGDSAKKGPDVIQAVAAEADVTLRLPERYAIERALVYGVPEGILRGVLVEMKPNLLPKYAADFKTLSGTPLFEDAQKFLKAGNLHAQFIAYLDENVYPPVARMTLERAINAASNYSDSGLVQLSLSS